MNSYSTTENRKTKSLSLPAFAILCVAIVGVFALAKFGGLRHHSSAGGVANFATNDDSSTESTNIKFVDLRKFYNAGLTTNWMGGGRVRGRDLSQLPQGVNSLSGVAFQVQDVVQLRGSGLRNHASFYPESVKGIRVNMKCAKIHFLHGTAWAAIEGTAIGAYDIHFADGSHLEIPIVYGADVRDWSFDANDVHQTNGAAWSSKEGRFFVRIYKSTWQNPKAAVEVKDIDFLSLGSSCYPFLLSITVE